MNDPVSPSSGPSPLEVYQKSKDALANVTAIISDVNVPATQRTVLCSFFIFCVLVAVCVIYSGPWYSYCLVTFAYFYCVYVLRKSSGSSI